MLVLLDTSILIFLAERPSSYLDDLQGALGKVELCVTRPVIGELRSLSGTRGSRAKKAKGALTFVDGLRVIEHGGEADDSLVSVALAEGATVGTLDQELVASLRRKGIPVATVKGDRLLFFGARL